VQHIKKQIKTRCLHFIETIYVPENFCGLWELWY
jgi:hypothetical protein